MHAAACGGMLVAGTCMHGLDRCPTQRPRQRIANSVHSITTTCEKGARGEPSHEGLAVNGMDMALRCAGA